MSIPTREWQLVRRPHGEPVDDDFRLVSVSRPDPGPGEVVVRTIAMSVDPYMRGRMNEGPSYAPRWELGETMQGGTVGQVVTSRAEPSRERVTWQVVRLMPVRTAAARAGHRGAR